MSDDVIRGKKLLLVEDMATNRKVMMTLLEDTGLEIDCAVNGIEAVDKVSAEPEKYDMVFMDLRMPKMGGLDATRQIRALPPRQRGRLPIVAMTANTAPEDIAECVAAGMDDHMGKPIDMDMILAILHKYLPNE